ncbi:hypothetical protein [Cesiribacter andamanensis]|uniref:Uncharacterized protein n=1 Tax=Cesiribacter andamanensis AMV16 TaxID=1279009 RepID=M7NAD2_9BACT|nr:hypothetical protein [Cesiribacter andamanensis]EMR04212.1 hypothetical protein ADICEAN_00620 [Cesiribacter andamanensis AMV16]
MTSKQLLSFFLFFFSSGTLYGQTEIGKWMWYEGGVELKTGTQMQGYIKFSSEATNDVLQIYINNTPFDYDARQIRLFWVYDERINTMRTFYALPYFPAKNKVEFRFFEALVEGEYMLALQKLEYDVKQNLVYENRAVIQENIDKAIPEDYSGIKGFSSYNPLFTNFASFQVIEANNVTVPYLTIYLITPTTFVQRYNEPTPMNTQPVYLRNPQKKVLQELMQDEEKRINAFITKNRLSLRKPGDVLRIVAYFNEIKQQAAE